MSILVGNIPGILGTNTGYKFPNKVPTCKWETIDATPIHSNFFLSFIDLWGDYNYAIYNGVHYFLYREEIIDETTKHFKYRLVRDMGTNILKQGVEVLGTVTKGNKDELLEQNLNRCYGDLIQPARLIQVNFKEQKINGQNNVEIKKIASEFPQSVLSTLNFNKFKNIIRGDFVTRYKLAKENGYKDKPQSFIFGYLKASTTTNGGKKQVRDLINDFLDDFNDTTKAEKKIIVEVSSSLFGASPLVGSYSISDKDSEAIGTAATKSIKINSIDLNNVIDIIPVRINDLGRNIPTTDLNENNGLFDIGARDDSYEPWETLGKITRKARLPIGELNPSGSSYDKRVYKGNSDINSQLIELKSGEVGKLGHVDRLDFILVNQAIAYEKTNVPYPFISYIGSTNRYEETEIKEVFKEDTPPYGWLMFQMVKPFGNGRQFEYIGEREFQEVEYYSGLTDNFIRRYQDTSKWFNNLPDEINSIAGNYLFSRMHLDFEFFAWLYFAPKYKGYDYGYDYEDGFKHGQYTGGNYYTNLEVYETVSTPDNKRIVTPFKGINNYRPHAIERQKALNNFTLRTLTKLPGKIKKGDYLFTSLEYDFREVDERHGYSNQQEYDNKGKGIEYTPGGVYYSATAKTFYIDKHRNNNYLGDFLNDPEYSLLKDKADITRAINKLVVLSNRKGEIEIRLLQAHNTSFVIDKLSNSQIVKSVDNSEGVDLTLYRLSKPDLTGVSFDPDNGTDRNTKEILYLFYSSLQTENEKGEKVSEYQTSFIPQLEHTQARGDGINIEELKTGDIGQLFKLVGTPGFAFIRKGKVHLITQEVDLFEPLQEKLNTLDVEGKEELNNLTILEKINQQNVLTTFTQPHYLKTKFNFGERDSAGNLKPLVFDVTVTGYKPTELLTNFDNYLVSAHNEFDLIENKWIVINKEPIKGQAAPSQLELDNLRLMSRRNQEDYDINRDRQAFAKTKMAEEFRMQEGDLAYRKTNRIIEIVANTVTALPYIPFSKMSAAAMQGPRDFVQAKKKGLLVSKELYPFAPWQAYPRSVYAAEKAAGAVGGMRDLLVAFPEYGERIATQKGFAEKELSFRDYQLDTTYLRQKENLGIEMNAIAHYYDRPEINDALLVKEYNKKHGLNNINMKIYLPTKQQLKVAEEYRKHFGVNCQIPNVVTRIEQGMEPNVIQYQTIEDDNIFGITIREEKEGLKAMLEKGISIIIPTAARPSTTFIKQIQLTEEVEFLQQSKDVLVGNIKALEDKLHESQQARAKESKECEDYKAKKELELIALGKKLIDLRKQKNRDIKVLNDRIKEAKEILKDVDGEELKDKATNVLGQRNNAWGRINNTTNNILAEIKGDTLEEKTRTAINQLHSANNEVNDYREEERKILEELREEQAEASNPNKGVTALDKVKAIKNRAKLCNVDENKAREILETIKNIPNLDNIAHYANLNGLEKIGGVVGKFTESKRAEAEDVDRLKEECESGKKKLEDQVKLYGEQIKKKEELEGQLLISRRREAEFSKLCKEGYTRQQLLDYGEDRASKMFYFFNQVTYFLLIGEKSDGPGEESGDNGKRLIKRRDDIPLLRFAKVTDLDKSGMRGEEYKAAAKHIWQMNVQYIRFFKKFEKIKSGTSVAIAFSTYPSDSTERSFSLGNTDIPTPTKCPELPADLPDGEDEVTKTKEENGDLKAKLLLADHRLRIAAEDAAKCKEAPKEKEAACLFPTGEEYQAKYKDLSDEDGDKEFNIENNGRLESKQFRDYFILLSYVYSQANDPNMNDNQKQIGKTLLRRLVERAILNSERYYYETGINLPASGNAFTQAQGDGARLRQMGLQQYIRTTYANAANNSFVNLKTAGNNMNSVISKYKPEDFRNPDKLKRAGMLCRLFIGEFMKLNPRVEIGKGLNEGIQIIEVARGQGPKN